MAMWRLRRNRRIRVSTTDYPHYRADLARVHHLGFGFLADTCARGVLALLASVRERDGLVVELGCGSGHLTRHLLKGAHRVIATDASPAMLELARRQAPNVEDLRLLVLPDDPIPAADAIVSVGHVLSYLPNDNVLIDTSYVPELLREYGVNATLGSSFGGEDLPTGLVTIHWPAHPLRQGITRASATTRPPSSLPA